MHVFGRHSEFDKVAQDQFLAQILSAFSEAGDELVKVTALKGISSKVE